MVIFEKVRTAQDRLSEKFQALYASAISPVTGNSSLRNGPFPQNLSEYH